ncbi:DUF2730 family protein [Zestomonas carbonaria]|uniref:DUF2730 family protein n=1 Tax=Zestomonas carbonaria TaxID=2762745 RepID=A0A7U7ELJ4_9GAMM|nr:DUF2730 family protein [Pseudomonas carbonaria]CAD5107222.1 hypothetical protein PSEWESI4_01493 [Pseudomonas carbonaria]
MDLDFALRAGQFLFTAVVGLYSLSAARRSSSKAEAEQLASRMAGQDNRILVLEQRMNHLPDAQQLTELAGELADLAGDLKAMRAEVAGLAREMAPLARSVDRINDYLLHARTQ